MRIAQDTVRFDPISSYNSIDHPNRSKEFASKANINPEQYQQIVNATDISWALPKVVWHLEDLRLGMSYPNYYISRLASKFVKVCLSGAGGDELYAGYPWRYYHGISSTGRDKFLRQYYNYWQRLVNDEAKKNLFNARTFKAIGDIDTFKTFSRVFTYNLDLDYEYKVIVTNKTETAKSVVLFHNGRGSQESIFGDAKTDTALGVIPCKRLLSNQVFTLASMMAHNFSREMQMLAHPAACRAKPKRPAAWKFKKLDTIRHQIIQRAGRLTRPQGKLTLTMSPNRTVRKDLSHFMDVLQKAA